LTGLFNRYHFDATMNREIARCRRYGVPLSLLLVDVDRLKLMNDRWGHHAGDQALGRVAAAIQKSLRGTDIAARLAGDEFGIILRPYKCPQGESNPCSHLERVVS